MKIARCLRVIRVLAVLLGGLQMGLTARASCLDAIGVTLLRTVTTNVDGTGIRVAQSEAGAPDFEVNPANSWVQQPAGLFTYISSNGTASYFPNSLGSDSGHADEVASNFYGMPVGIATNVAHVDNFDANSFVQVEEFANRFSTSYVAVLPSSNIDDSVVNQSFIFTGASVAVQQAIDSGYDNYAAQYHTLFVSGAGNSGPVSPPATCYNGIGVGDYGGGSSYGPTPDNGRAKPDITAPEGYSSFSTPEVSGAAALLMQAGLRGDGGSNTNAAADIRTVKALLLNGAIKPVDWTNLPPSPLDTNYGAGILNAFNSYEQLAGGQHGYIVATTVSTNSPHPPTGASGTIDALNGWDFNTNFSTSTSDGINHYYFNVTNGLNQAAFTATATLVWNRQLSQTNINNLDLFLYDAVSSNLIAASTSVVDNVEHIWLPQLPQGRYDLQVLKHGGSNTVSSNETYALAWEFFYMTLNVTQSDTVTNVVLTWPVYPDGFVVETTTNLAPPIVWSMLNATPAVTNNQNQVTLNATNATQFFRLQRP
ncbi:MAG: S8 family serine peptidase [Verrucomicrobiia bacterium]